MTTSKGIHVGIMLHPTKGWLFRTPNEEDQGGDEEDKPDDWQDYSEED